MQIKTNSSTADCIQNKANVNGRITRAQAKKFGIDMNTNGLESKAKKRKLSTDCRIESKQSEATNPKRRKLNSCSQSVSTNVCTGISNQAAYSALDNAKSDQLAMPLNTSNLSTMSNSTHDTTASNALQIDTIQFKMNEIVWAKIKGYPGWPAQIISFESNRMALVRWFNDYCQTKLYCTQLSKFFINFELHAKNFDKTVGLKTAAREALYSYARNENI